MSAINRHSVLGCFAGGALTLVGLFVIAVALGWMMERSAGGGGGGFGLPAPPVPAVRAPMDWAVETLDGKGFSLDACAGSVVFLNFWATWCGPCKAEMPAIQGLYESLKDEGVRFVCVTREEAPKVRAFLEGKGYTFPIYRMEGKPPAAFESPGIPATFIIDRDGVLVFKHVGAADWDDEACIRYLKSLAFAPRPAADE